MSRREMIVKHEKAFMEDISKGICHLGAGNYSCGISFVMYDAISRETCTTFGICPECIGYAGYARRKRRVGEHMRRKQKYR